MDKERLEALLSEYTTLAASYDKYATTGYTILPIALAVLGGITTLTKFSNSYPVSMNSYSGLINSLILLIIISWVGTSHTLVNRIGLRLVEIELEIRREVPGFKQEKPSFFMSYLGTGDSKNRDDPRLKWYFVFFFIVACAFLCLSLMSWYRGTGALSLPQGLHYIAVRSGKGVLRWPQWLRYSAVIIPFVLNLTAATVIGWMELGAQRRRAQLDEEDALIRAALAGKSKNGKSVDFLEAALGSVQKSTSENSHRHPLLYYLYPRPNDWQKSLFLLLGCAVGGLIAKSVLPDPIGKTILTFFVLDVFVYQARYQWNDVRDAIEDEKLDSDRARLPVKELGLPLAVKLSVITAVCKLVIAGILIIINIEIRIPLLVSSLLIFTLAIFYEGFREREDRLGSRAKVHWTLLVVGFGYPLRFFAGLWALNPSLTLNPGAKVTLLLVVLLLIVSLFFFGRMFVSLCWVLKDYDLMFPLSDNSGRTADAKEPKGHMYWLIEKNGHSKSSELSEGEKEYPLRKRGEVQTPWNHAYVSSVVFYSAAVSLILFDKSHLLLWIFLVLVSSAFQVVMAISMVLSDKRGQLLLIIIIPIALQMFYIFLAPSLAMKFLGALMVVLGIGYSVFFWMFRNINYKIMKNFLPKMFKGLSKGFLSLFLGKDTFAELSKKSN